MAAAYTEPASIESVLFPAFRASLPRMDGKVVAVTGCTSGTGFVCARTCAELGARVIMLNRASRRADDALLALQRAAPQARITQVSCDLTSFDAVRQAAQELREELAGTGLDVLCNNAGIMAAKDEATRDGCDTQMQTNHLSHFLLTAEVWPLLEKAVALRGEARVVNHSSGARRGPKIEKQYFERNGGNLGGDGEADPGGNAPFGGGRWARYQQSKLANVVFTYALRDRCAQNSSQVKVLVAHPGLASTNLQVTTAADGGMQDDFTHGLMRKAQSQEDGSMGVLRCCCEPNSKTGDFYGPKGMTGSADLLDAAPEEKRADPASRDLLWEVSMEITGGRFPFSRASKL